MAAPTSSARVRLAAGLADVPDQWDPDGAPVRVVFLVLTPLTCSGQHVKILARIARLMHNPSSNGAARGQLFRKTFSLSYARPKGRSSHERFAVLQLQFEHRAPSSPGVPDVTASVSATSMRTHYAGGLRAADAGVRVTLGGWVHRARNLGGIVFLDLRDREGIVQLSFGPGWASAEAIASAAAVGVESVVIVEGRPSARRAETRNPDMSTGEIEVHATSLRVVGPAVTPAIPVARGKGENVPAEELRLRHRHLDLRRPELQEKLILRHRLLQRSRQYLSERGFLEIETPILTKPTPEGARDYLVPSRVHAGEFYALPQSPQIYKQLFMVSGFDRYFQIARCFRDEDLRADRQPEFTQIDIEASFVAQEDILALAEGLVGALWREGGHVIPSRFERMTYRDAMERYGSDRPDLRYGLEIDDYTGVFRGPRVRHRRQPSRRAAACEGSSCPAARRGAASRSMSSRRWPRARAPEDCSASSEWTASMTVPSPSSSRNAAQRRTSAHPRMVRLRCSSRPPTGFRRRRSIAFGRR